MADSGTWYGRGKQCGAVGGEGGRGRGGWIIGRKAGPSLRVEGCDQQVLLVCQRWARQNVAKQTRSPGRLVTMAPNGHAEVVAACTRTTASAEPARRVRGGQSKRVPYTNATFPSSLASSMASVAYPPTASLPAEEYKPSTGMRRAAQGVRLSARTIDRCPRTGRATPWHDHRSARDAGRRADINELPPYQTPNPNTQRRHSARARKVGGNEQACACGAGRQDGTLSP